MFKYHNENPNGYRIPDCVIRAITLAMNIPYYDVIKMLHNNGIKMKCDDLCVCCYEKLLDNDFKLPHFESYNKTAKEVANDFKDRIILLRMDGHLSCAIYGDIYDIWDCSNEIITDFWLI